MTLKTILGLVVAATAIAGAAGQRSQTARDTDPVRSLLSQYEQSLNSGNVDGLVKLYAPDGVVMPADVPVQIGGATIRRYFEQLFRDTSLSLKIIPIEVTTSRDWGFARVEITGTRTRKAVGKPDRLDNKALLILQPTADGAWRIARYIFNRNAPASGPQ